MNEKNELDYFSQMQNKDEYKDEIKKNSQIIYWNMGVYLPTQFSSHNNINIYFLIF